MKIDQQNVASTTSSQSIGSSSSSGQRKFAALGNSGDQAELSGLSKAIQTFQGDRASRVNQLTALVRSGQYDANPARISAGIVNEALSAGSQPAGAVAR
jgi:hypothetical protein